MNPQDQNQTRSPEQAETDQNEVIRKSPEPAEPAQEWGERTETGARVARGGRSQQGHEQANN